MSDDQARTQQIIERMARWSHHRWVPPGRSSPPLNATVVDNCPHHGDPDGIEAGLAVGGTWEAASPLDLPNAHRKSESIHLDTGTLLRCEHSNAWANAFDVWSIIFRLHVLSGSHLGACVLIEPDGELNLMRHGLVRRA